MSSIHSGIHVVCLHVFFSDASLAPPGQNGHHFADDIFKYNFLSGNILISIEIALNFIPNVPISNIPTFGSDNGLAPTRRQAIIGTNADPIH